MPALLSDDTKRTATVERIPDPNGLDLEAAWDAEWEKNLWDTALARVKTQFKPKQFQMFDLYVMKEWPVKEVARALGVTATHARDEASGVRCIEERNGALGAGSTVLREVWR
jgi:hypothetical protein